jgi:hypothetical protein
MNDIQGSSPNNLLGRHSAVAEFRGGQALGPSKPGQRPKGASWEIITRSHSRFIRTERPQPCYVTLHAFQSELQPNSRAR